MKSLFVEMREKKDKTGFYPVMIADLGYRQAIVSFDRNFIAEVCNLTIQDVMTLPKDFVKVLF